MRFLWFFFPAALLANIDYSVYFIGIDDKETLKSLKAVSDLTTLQDRPPASLNALRYRAESDIPELIQVLHAHGYYEATVDVRIDETEVFVMIAPGPVYTIETFEVDFHPNPCRQEFGVEIGKPALAKEILEEEQKIVARLADCGFPLATIEKQEIIADGKTKTLRIHIDVDTGPTCHFGASEVEGLTSVRPKLITKKTAWKEGDLYSSSSDEKTEKELLDTGLFSSVLIRHENAPPDKLPMKIEVNETKHRSVNVGASYQTFFGPGLTFGWEDRNISGMGRRLSLQGDLTKKTHSGVATFLVPDCFRLEQDYVAEARAMHEKIFAYGERSYSLTNRVERKIGTKYRVAMGLKLERIIVGESIDNGTFSLLEVPLYFRFSSANDLLNPTQGSTLEYKAIPSVNFSHADRYYLSQSLAYMVYWPVIGNDFLVVAQQILLEAIWSRRLDAIPVPKRVLGGSEQELRGYRYRTVSPLDGHRPIGGRSGIFYTFEPRFRVTKTIGLVPFFDIGSVYASGLPNFREKWLKSVGLGIRYFTFLGPLRFDIAFPLDRRKAIDPMYRVLISIGQTF